MISKYSNFFANQVHYKGRGICIKFREVWSTTIDLWSCQETTREIEAKKEFEFFYGIELGLKLLNMDDNWSRSLTNGILCCIVSQLGIRNAVISDNILSIDSLCMMVYLLLSIFTIIVQKTLKEG